MKGKRAKKTNKRVDREVKLQEWESDYYESYKNSESEEEEDSDDENKKEDDENGNDPGRSILRKRNAINFKKKILKSEKKSNLLKLNCNLRQLIYDEFDSLKTQLLFNNYLHCAKGVQKTKRLQICTICLGFIKLCKCSTCHAQICQKCVIIHSDLGCGIVS